jgi:hypothetical protein
LGNEALLEVFCTELIFYRVFLSATNEKALSKVSLEEFKKFAAKE